jgi:hypothetical protein
MLAFLKTNLSIIGRLQRKVVVLLLFKKFVEEEKCCA